MRMICAFILALFSTAAQAETPKPTYEAYLERTAVPRLILDQWLESEAWVKFDPELGYTLSNSIMPWGINKSATIETIQANGARRTMLYAGTKPRINTYGDSFTESNQVSDAETWQEYIAGHLGEPVVNFGVGGYGVYQAYRRMLREEVSPHGAEYVILMICCDDSTRSLLRSRRAAFFEYWPEAGGKTFHGNFWSNLEMDLRTGKFVEKPQLLPSTSMLYKMTDPRWMAQALKDDLALQLMLYSQGKTRNLDRPKISRLARFLEFQFDWTVSERVVAGTDTTPMRMQAKALLNRYSQRATIHILSKASAFANSRSKKLLVVLNGNASIEEMRDHGTREDQELVDHLNREKLPYIDLNLVFLEGLKRSGLSVREYMAPLLVNGAGHFNPTGNHYIAYQIIPKLAQWLEPKPIPYRDASEQDFVFRDYLKGGMYEATPER